MTQSKLQTFLSLLGIRKFLFAAGSVRSGPGPARRPGAQCPAGRRRPAAAATHMPCVGSGPRAALRVTGRLPRTVGGDSDRGTTHDSDDCDCATHWARAWCCPGGRPRRGQSARRPVDGHGGPSGAWPGPAGVLPKTFRHLVIGDSESRSGSELGPWRQ